MKTFKYLLLLLLTGCDERIRVETNRDYISAQWHGYSNVVITATLDGKNITLGEESK